MSSGPVAGFPGGTGIPRDDIIGFDCELLLPAAQPDVVTTDNAAKISARVIIEGASIPVTVQANDPARGGRSDSRRTAAPGARPAPQILRANDNGPRPDAARAVAVGGERAAAGSYTSCTAWTSRKWFPEPRLPT